MTAEQMKYEFEVGYDRITNFDAPGYEPKEISTFLTRAQEEIVYDILAKSANVEKNRKAVSMLREYVRYDSAYFSTGDYPNGYSIPLLLSVGGTGISFSSVANTVNNGDGLWNERGFRPGDVVVITGATSSNNNGSYLIESVTDTVLTFTSDNTLGTTEVGVADTLVSNDRILKVRNERMDITLSSDHEFYGKFSNDRLTDLRVNPIDDDFYHANKDNPYKKPSEKSLWRLDYAGIVGMVNTKLHEYVLQENTTPYRAHIYFDRRPKPIIVPETTAVPYASADGSIDGYSFVWFPSGLNCQLDPIIHRMIVDRAVKFAYAALQDQTGFEISSIQEQQK